MKSHKVFDAQSWWGSLQLIPLIRNADDRIIAYADLSEKPWKGGRINRRLRRRRVDYEKYIHLPIFCQYKIIDPLIILSSLRGFLALKQKGMGITLQAAFCKGRFPARGRRWQWLIAGFVNAAGFS